MLEDIKIIALTVISGVILWFIERLLDKKSNKNDKPKKDNFIRNTTLIIVITEILTVLLGSLSVYFYCNNNSSAFSILFMLAGICLEQSFISLYGLSSAAKIFFASFRDDQDNE